MVGRDVEHLSRMQLDRRRCSQRLGQGPMGAASSESDAEPPDFVFYTGCNVLKTPHIALLALDIMDALGVTYRVMGGPTHCCGVVQHARGRRRDLRPRGRETIDKLRRARADRCSRGARPARCSSPK